jgi:hypothetical protein
MRTPIPEPWYMPELEPIVKQTLSRHRYHPVWSFQILAAARLAMVDPVESAVRPR